MRRNRSSPWAWPLREPARRRRCLRRHGRSAARPARRIARPGCRVPAGRRNPAGRRGAGRAVLAAARRAAHPHRDPARQPVDRAAADRRHRRARRARQLADFTVVDCGFCLETDEELSFDSLAPRRNGATLAVLDEADCVVVVGAADPIGMQRLVRASPSCATPRSRPRSGSCSTRFAAASCRAIPAPNWSARWSSSPAPRPAALLPYDRDSLDSALASGPLARRGPPGQPAAPGGREPRRRARRRARPGSRRRR